MSPVRVSVVRCLLVAMFGWMLAAGLAGCASDRPQDIPFDATLRAEGDGQLSFAAQEEGRVYVWDASAKRMVYSGQLNRGDKIEVNPSERRVSINGKPVVETGWPSGDHLEIYFDKERPPRAAVY